MLVNEWWRPDPGVCRRSECKVREERQRARGTGKGWGEHPGVCLPLQRVLVEEMDAGDVTAATQSSIVLKEVGQLQAGS
jgi:hypothetical protein